MRGSIRKRESGLYQITVDLGKDPLTGKRKQKSVGGIKTKKEAESALAELISKIEKGEFYEQKEQLLCDYLKQWLSHVKHNVVEGTYEFYRDIADRVLTPALGKAQIHQLRPLHIQSMLTEKLNTGLSPTTVRHYYNTLNIALNQAVKWQIIQINPCNAVEPPKRTERDYEVLSPDEIDMLMEYTKTSEFSVMYIPLQLGLFCGMRRGEICGLKWENVDFDKGIIRVRNNRTRVGKDIREGTPKTDNSKRDIEVPSFTLRALEDHRTEQKANKLLFGLKELPEYVCTWPDGRPLRPDYVTQTIKKITKKCNLPDIRLHDTRHTHATILVEEGVPVNVVSERLGHSKIDVTLNIYSHVTQKAQKQAVDKLENLFSKQVK